MNTTLIKAAVAEPQLRAPGAGLPPMEARFFRHGLPLLARAISREAARKMFLREGHRILYLAQDLEDWDLEERVLVKRPFGVEDNSRNWSMSMLLEHLIMTGISMNKTIRQLSIGVRPHYQPRVVDGKPKGERGSRVRDEFSRFIDKFIESVDQLQFPPRPTLAHQWTGEMNAAQWLKFAALHHWMHRVHAERIVAEIQNL